VYFMCVCRIHRATPLHHVVHLLSTVMIRSSSTEVLIGEVCAGHLFHVVTVASCPNDSKGKPVTQYCLYYLYPLQSPPHACTMAGCCVHRYDDIFRGVEIAPSSCFVFLFGLRSSSSRSSSFFSPPTLPLGKSTCGVFHPGSCSFISITHSCKRNPMPERARVVFFTRGVVALSLSHTRANEILCPHITVTYG
jgi:hypothetical protein